MAMDLDITAAQRRRWADTRRVGAMLAVALLLLQSSTPLARLVHMPELAWIGLTLGLGFLGAGASHVARRLFFPRLDLQAVAVRAVRDGQAGHVFLGVCIVLAALVLTMGSAKANELDDADRFAGLPPGARQHLPVLLREQRDLWPSASASVLAAQVEQETCPSLTHRNCWSPRAELRTDRERGVGLGQITRTPRFDAIEEMRAKHPRQLAAWRWEDQALYDPTYQVRALVLMDRGNYERIVGAASETDHQAMMLVAYNAGPGRVVSDRRLCGATPRCDPARWFDHAERTSALPRVSTHSGYRSFFEISREYPRRILIERRPRYLRAVGESVG